MPDADNETLTAEQFRHKYGNESQQELDGLEPPHRKFDTALAIDPGTDTGLAWPNGERIKTLTTDFWGVYHQLDSTYDKYTGPDETCLLLEAPYKSRPGMSADQSATAYRSGQVAREAELLLVAAERLGYTVIEHDPSQQGRKWDSQFAESLVGAWEGPDNEHVRDALRLLFIYQFL
jgi:hypothetical protein